MIEAQSSTTGAQRWRLKGGDGFAPFPLQATIDALCTPVAVLDITGEIVAANAAWRPAPGARQHARCPLGVNILEWWRSLSEEGEELARGVGSVLSGARQSYEQTCRTPGAEEVHVAARPIRHQSPARFLVSQETSVVSAADDRDDRVLTAQIEERERLAGELHDSVGQNLVSLGLSLARLRGASAPHSELAAIVDEMGESLQQAHAEIRTLSFLLQPPWAEGSGAIEKAIRDLATGFARRAGLRADLRIEPIDGRLCRNRQMTLFRVLQEALVNVHRHARADRVEVQLAQRDGRVILTVRDNGRGMLAAEGATPNPGVGILSMRTRLQRLGGDLRIASHRDGTTLTARLPTADLT
jgi:signal transduction histidine kinase